MKRNKVVLTIWIFYITALIYVLFIRRIGVTYPLTYRDWLSQCYNLIPGRALYDYFSAPYQSSAVLRRIIFNYGGNLLLFTPWGFLFGIGNAMLKKFVICTITVVVAVEFLQYFTMLGSFDIEDIILNVSGATIGFLIVRQIKNNRIVKRRCEKSL